MPRGSIRSGNIYSITHNQLVKIVKRVYETKESLFVQGAIGIGKSESVRRAAKEIAQERGLEFIETKSPNQYPDRFCLVDIRLAQKDAGEILGLPENYALIEKNDNLDILPVKALDVFLSNNHDSEYRIIDYITRWNPPSWFPRKGNGIIFVDEFNLAPPLVQYAMYELINDRALGDYHLPEGWVVIGAGNRGSLDGATTFEFPAPLNDRFLWYELKMPSVEKWTEYAARNGVDYRIIGFLQTTRSAIYTFNPKSKEKAFATPRSWVKASRLIKGVEDEDLVELYLSGAVGSYVAKQFRAYLQARRTLPPTEKYIKDPKGTMLPKENDLLYTLCTNLVEYLSYHKDDKDQGLPILRSILIFSERLSMEFRTFLLKLIKLSDESYFKENIIKIPEFDRICSTISKYLLREDDD